MSEDFQPQIITIPKQHVQHFLGAIVDTYKEAFSEAKERLNQGLPIDLPRILDEDGAFIVSFTHRWEPFLGVTHGLNKDPEQRYRLDGKYGFVREILPHLELLRQYLGERRKGGRYFIRLRKLDHGEVYRKAGGGSRIAVRFNLVD